MILYVAVKAKWLKFCFKIIAENAVFPVVLLLALNK